MKFSFYVKAFIATSLVSSQLPAQTSPAEKPTENLYIDVHHIGAGKVKYDGVAEAHAKDLAVENKYGVHFIKYWVDEKNGTVYCLSSSPDSQSIRKTHAEAHGLLPDQIYLVTEGTAAMEKGSNPFFLDIHELGLGNVTAKDVAGAHQKDLAVENKYGVNFINYWVNEKDGLVMCLSQAADSSEVIKTHAEAHGLIPKYVMEVKEGD